MKRKLTQEEKLKKQQNREKYEYIFINGKQKRVKRPATVDGTLIEDYLDANADVIFWHQSEQWEKIQN